jgi:hypothetical protein
MRKGHGELVAALGAPWFPPFSSLLPLLPFFFPFMFLARDKSGVENGNRKGGVVWVKVVLTCGSKSSGGT